MTYLEAQQVGKEKGLTLSQIFELRTDVSARCMKETGYFPFEMRGPKADSRGGNRYRLANPERARFWAEEDRKEVEAERVAQRKGK